MRIPTRWRDVLDNVLGPQGHPVRLMRRDDLEDVVRLIRLHDSADGKAARVYFEKPGHFEVPYEIQAHFVVLDPDTSRVVGVSGYGVDPSIEADKICWLGWTYVNPHFQGRSFGSRVIKFALEQTRQLGARKMYAETSSLESFAKAVAFYKRLGFVEEGRLRDFYGEGEDKIILGLRLDAPIQTSPR